MDEKISLAADAVWLAVNLLIVASVVAAVRDVWFKSQLQPFVTWKAYTELWEGWIGELLKCSMCLTFHISWIVLLLYFLPAMLIGCWYRWAFYALAVAGLVNRFKLWEGESYGK